MSDAVERPRFAVRVENGRLIADGPWEQECIDKLPKSRLIIEVHTEEPEDGVRAIFMAGIKVLFDNIDGTGPGGKWPTPRSLRRDILKATGFSEPIVSRVDGYKLDARSMARGKMDYEELVAALELARVYCLEHWGFDPFQTWQDAKDMEKHG